MFDVCQILKFMRVLSTTKKKRRVKACWICCPKVMEGEAFAVVPVEGGAQDVVGGCDGGGGDVTGGAPVAAEVVVEVWMKEFQGWAGRIADGGPWPAVGVRDLIDDGAGGVVEGDGLALVAEFSFPRTDGSAVAEEGENL